MRFWLSVFCLFLVFGGAQIARADCSNVMDVMREFEILDNDPKGRSFMDMLEKIDRVEAAPQKYKKPVAVMLEATNAMEEDDIAKACAKMAELKDMLGVEGRIVKDLDARQCSRKSAEDRFERVLYSGKAAEMEKRRNTPEYMQWSEYMHDKTLEFYSAFNADDVKGACKILDEWEVEVGFN